MFLFQETNNILAWHYKPGVNGVIVNEVYL
jgi:hypothetical protein